MRDTELYRHLLGLEPPWEVTRVELALKEGRVALRAPGGGRADLAGLVITR